MLSRAASRIVKNEATDSGRWSAYEPRPGDVIIGTAPKVGTHWTLQIVSLLVFQSPEPRDLAFAPWLDAQFLAPLDEVLKKIESQAHRRILFSHLPLDAMPIYDEVQYIHVARDGRDATVVAPIGLWKRSAFKALLSREWTPGAVRPARGADAAMHMQPLPRGSRQ